MSKWTSEDLQRYGKAVRRRRATLGLGPRPALAAKVGISPRWLDYIETGKRAASEDTLTKLDLGLRGYPGDTSWPPGTSVKILNGDLRGDEPHLFSQLREASSEAIEARILRALEGVSPRRREAFLAMLEAIRDDSGLKDDALRAEDEGLA